MLHRGISFSAWPRPPDISCSLGLGSQDSTSLPTNCFHFVNSWCSFPSEGTRIFFTRMYYEARIQLLIWFNLTCKIFENRYFQNKCFSLELWFSLSWLKLLMICWNCINTSSHACSQVFVNLLPSQGTLLANGILTALHYSPVFPSLHLWLFWKGAEWFNVMFW
jgi:hypothetical protein